MIIYLSRAMFSAALVLVAGCTESGKVDQGKVVAFDKEQRLVTIVREGEKVGAGHLPPPVTYVLPASPREIGPLPKNGDVVRIYYKDPGKALRFMNVTRTDIFKK